MSVTNFNTRHAGTWALSGEPDMLGLYALRDLVRGVDTGAAAAPDALIEAGASVGRGTWVEQGARVGQGAQVGESVHIGQGACIGRWASIGDRAWIGRGAWVAHGGQIEGEVWIPDAARLLRDAAPRPRRAIEAARGYALGSVTAEELAAARAAARDAAEDAFSAASYSAAWAAAGSVPEAVVGDVSYAIADLTAENKAWEALEEAWEACAQLLLRYHRAEAVAGGGR